jgi:hypothetical protein
MGAASGFSEASWKTSVHCQELFRKIILSTYAAIEQQF